MTGDEAVKVLRAIASGEHYNHRDPDIYHVGIYDANHNPVLYDAEEQHRDADNVLCTLLNQLGYDDVVRAWHDVDKWYA